MVLGTRDANELFTSNLEFRSRTYDTVSLRAMRWGETVDEKIWIDLCRDMDAAMKEADVVDKIADPHEFAEPLCRAALGRIGLLKKIVQTALRFTLRRQALRIDRENLATAIDVWAIRNRYLKTNPFRTDVLVG